MCPSHVTSPVFWHELDFTACHFIHYSLAKHIDRCFRLKQSFEYVGGGKLGEVDIVRFILCSVPVKRIKTKLLDSLMFKLCYNLSCFRKIRKEIYGCLLKYLMPCPTGYCKEHGYPKIL